MQLDSPRTLELRYLFTNISNVYGACAQPIVRRPEAPAAAPFLVDLSRAVRLALLCRESDSRSPLAGDGTEARIMNFLAQMDKDERRLAHWLGLTVGGLFATVLVLNAINF